MTVFDAWINYQGYEWIYEKVSASGKLSFYFSERVLLFIKFMKLSIIFIVLYYLVISWNVSHCEIQN